MAFFDKLEEFKNKAVNAAVTASTIAQNSVEQARQNHAKKVEESKALDEEMKQKAEDQSIELTNDLLEACNHTNGGFFGDLEENQILSFTKDFYEKLVLPGGRTSTSCLNMHPYFDVKQIKKLEKSFGVLNIMEKPVFYIKDKEKQEILVTTQTLYFHRALEENTKYFINCKIPVEKISNFTLEDTENNYYIFKCDDYELAKIRLFNAYKQDFISLNEYFRSIKEKDFDITDEEIDQLIQQKIGSKIYEQVSKYKTYDDELVLFYAGGLDSLLATDYVACTNHQIIIVDREMLGSTANIRQYYYEDITSMATLQNSNSGDLIVDAISSALTASLKICDLDMSVSGSHNKISTLNMIEAQRVIAIYHARRKAAKEALRQPQFIPSATPLEKTPDIMEQLEKLAKLKEAGILTEDEFTSKKTELLNRL